ncbi:MAG: YciI family protein, partial [Cyanobacteria bacterium P01_G01_bin.38]
MMKVICLGYLDHTQWDEMPEDEQTAYIEACFAYDDELRRGGHFIGGEALQSVRSAATLRFQNGQVTVTDGPYAET